MQLPKLFNFKITNVEAVGENRPARDCELSISPLWHTSEQRLWIGAGRITLTVDRDDRSEDIDIYFDHNLLDGALLRYVGNLSVNYCPIGEMEEKREYITRLIASASEELARQIKFIETAKETEENK